MTVVVAAAMKKTERQLAKTAYHFNFRSKVLNLVVRQMNNRECDQVSDACCKAVEHIFATDTQGEVAMEASRLVAKLIKDYKGVLRPAVVRSFIKLPLRVHADEAQAAKIATAANAKKRKRDRELAELVGNDIYVAGFKAVAEHIGVEA